MYLINLQFAASNLSDADQPEEGEIRGLVVMNSELEALVAAVSF